MNNIRYSAGVSPGPGGVAGVVAAVILLINAIKRAGFVPASPPLQLLAPVAQLAAIVFVLGLLGWSIGSAEQRERPPAERIRAALTVLNVVVLAALVGVEFVINLVFAQLDVGIITTLRSGPLGIALTVVSFAFLVSAVALVLGYWNTPVRLPLLLYGLGAIPVALRALVPELVLDIGLVAMAIGVGLASIRLLIDARTRPAELPVRV
jgi:hypothetical protein